MEAENEEERLHQLLGVLNFLKESGYDTVARKLRYELKSKHRELPEELDGEWKWISHVEYVSSSEEEEESDSESEEEEESESEEEDDSESTGKSSPKRQATARKVVADDELNARVRKVKFADEVVETIISPKKSWNPEERKACFYNKADMKRFERENRVRKSEEAQAKLEELIAATGQTMGLSIPVFSST